MICDLPRCRQPSAVGVLPTGAKRARFVCTRHWLRLCAEPGSVCDALRDTLKK